MKTQTSKICAVLVMAIFLFSIVPVTSAKTLAEWDKTAVSKYNAAKVEYLKTKNFYTSARTDWVTAKDKYKRYRNSDDLPGALEKGKNFLLKADKTLIGYLKMIDSYVAGEPSLSDSEKTRIHNELISDISWLEEKQSEISDATTKEELKEIAKVIKNRWQEIKPAAKRIVGEVMNSKLLSLINNAETASEKIESKVDGLKAKGKDTADLEAWLVDFNEKIKLAKENHQKAKDKYAEIENIQDADRLFKEGNAFVKEANQYLRNSYKDLKKIVKEIKSN
tara:strand:+ start:124 stop:960 length:837 start_codon:yes stop_codon:yes gene_type:complete